MNSKNEVEAHPVRLRLARAGFSELVLVCSKCVKRQGLKKGSLRKLLKRELKGRTTVGKLRIVETGCLGPCPKRLMAVATTGSLVKQRIHLLDPTASAAESVDALFPDFGPKVRRALGADRSNSGR